MLVTTEPPTDTQPVLSAADLANLGLTQRQQRDTRAHRSIHAQIALARHDPPPAATGTSAPRKH